MIAGEFKVRLGVDADTLKVKEFVKTLGDIPLRTAVAITSLAGLGYGLTEMTRTVLEMANGFSIFTATTGENTTALQQWQLAAKQMGVQANVVDQAFGRFNAFLGNVATGRVDFNMARELGRAGVDWVRNPNINSMMEQLQAGLSRMAPRDASAILGAMGLSPELMRVYQMSAGERHGLRPEMTSGQTQAMADFQKQLAIFNQNVMTNFVDALTKVEPYLSDLTKALNFFVNRVGDALVWIGKAARAHELNVEASRAALGKYRAENAPVLTYNGGDHTYEFNLYGLNMDELAARSSVERIMKAEIDKQHALARAAFGGPQ